MIVLTMTREQVEALLEWPQIPHGYGTYYEARSKLYRALSEIADEGHH